MAAVLQQLQGVFDLVRLVDPERAKVLTLHPDGTLEEQAGHCHVVWNKAGRCENCISAKVFTSKKTLNKIEFNGEDAYFVLSRYVENTAAAACWNGFQAVQRTLAGYGRPPHAAGPQRGL